MIINEGNARRVVLLTALFLLCPLTADNAQAAKPDCAVDPSHPKCADDGGGDPPSGGNADPQFLFRDGGGIVLANADGTSQTEIRSNAIGPKLDAPGKKVLFIHSEGICCIAWMGFITYSVVDGNITVDWEQQLVHEDDFGGSLSSEGVSDWSPDGSKYSYSYRTGSGEQVVHRMMIAPDPMTAPDPDLFPNGDHMVAYESEPNGGLNSATWDQSGNFIYHSDSPVNVPYINGVFIIDVRTSPGKTLAVLDLGPIMVDSGFAEESNVQDISASSITGNYSFDPLNNVPASNNSLCLMVSTIDWSASNKNQPRFVHIIDLPGILDPGSNLHCPITTGTSPILGFLGTDFTTDDTGIIGQDHSKNRTTGVWVYDVGSESRTKIVGDGNFPDWTN